MSIVKTDVCVYTGSFSSPLFEVLQFLRAFQFLKNQMGMSKNGQQNCKTKI